MQLDSLLKYYQTELEFLVQGGKSFAKEYPNLAQTLDFSGFSSNDPDVQRLIESVAFLNAKLQKRLDEQAPEISQQILNAIYPQFITPIPSFTIMNFSHTQKPINALRKIPRGTKITTQKKFTNNYYTFQTTMPCAISAYEISNITSINDQEAQLPYNVYSVSNNAVLIELNKLIDEIGQEENKIEDQNELLFYINMVDNLAHDFYEAIMSLYPNKNTPVFENGVQIGEIEPVGLDDACNLFPANERENPAYKTLLEYTSFHKKFMFFRIKLTKQPEKNIIIPFNAKKEIQLKKGNLLLNCTPAINLFEKNSEPIIFDNKTTKYTILPDTNKKKEMDVYNILSIENTTPNSNKRYTPYFSAQHLLDNEKENIFWISKREPNRMLTEYETSISFLTPANEMNLSKNSVLYAKLLCFQKNAHQAIPAQEKWEITDNPGNIECMNLDRPTGVIKPVLNSRTQWRLISHLSINYFGFNDNNSALESIKELLSIYNFENKKNEAALHNLKQMDYKVGMISYNKAIVPKANINLIVDFEKSSEVFLLSYILSSFFAKILDFNTKLSVNIINNSNNEKMKSWDII